MRETRYARSGDAFIAYQVDGDGPIDLVIVTEGFIPVDMMAEEPHLARCLRRLAAFARVPRSFFVPEEARAEAEADRPLDIGCGQTISQPYVVAAMAEALELTGRERVLEVGEDARLDVVL